MTIDRPSSRISSVSYHLNKDLPSMPQDQVYAQVLFVVDPFAPNAHDANHPFRYMGTRSISLANGHNVLLYIGPQTTTEIPHQPEWDTSDLQVLVHNIPCVSGRVGGIKRGEAYRKYQISADIVVLCIYLDRRELYKVVVDEILDELVYWIPNAKIGFILLKSGLSDPALAEEDQNVDKNDYLDLLRSLGNETP